MLFGDIGDYKKSFKYLMIETVGKIVELLDRIGLIIVILATLGFLYVSFMEIVDPRKDLADSFKHYINSPLIITYLQVVMIGLALKGFKSIVLPYLDKQLTVTYKQIEKREEAKFQTYKHDNSVGKVR